MRCFKGAGRARSLSHNHYVGNISFFLKKICIYVVCIAVVLIIRSFLIVCCFVSFFFQFSIVIGGTWLLCILVGDGV